MRNRIVQFGFGAGTKSRMSNMASEQNLKKKHHEAFEEQVGISQTCKNEINKIKNNSPNLMGFYLERSDSEMFSALAWELLGTYISNNDHLDFVDLSAIHLTDSKMSLFFKNLTRDRSVERTDLSDNRFGLNGISSMVPFLKNNLSLTKLNIGTNNEMNTECFRLLIGALHHRGSIKHLQIDNCNIDDITALGQFILPNLCHLDLGNNDVQNLISLENYINLDTLRLRGNKIGKEGCQSLAALFQNQRSRLRILDLNSNHDIGDEEVEILARSLKCNTTLTELSLVGNDNINEGGLGAFLRLLVDVSSIENTHKNSNHTLRKLQLNDIADPKSTKRQMVRHIGSVLKLHRGRSYHATGRAKVIKFQLGSHLRMNLYRLQCIECSHGCLFSEIEPVLLPYILALTGNHHELDDLYCTMCTSAPDVTSHRNSRSLV